MGKQLTDAVPLHDEIDLDEAAAATADDGNHDGHDASNTEGNGADVAAAPSDQDAAALAAVAGAEDEDDDDDDGGGSGRAAQAGRVPQSRVNELTERRREAEARAAAREQENTQLRQLLQQALDKKTTVAVAAAPKPRDFEAEFEALGKRFEDGEMDESALRKAERKLGIEQAKAEVAAEYEPKLEALQRERDTEQQQRVQESWAREVADAIKAYPFLNHESDAANRKAIDAVRAECEELMQAGIPAPKALRLAVRDVAPQYGVAAKPTPEDAAAARKTAARKAVAEAENSQAPNMVGVGNGARTQGKQRLTASVKDHDTWEHVPEAQRDQAFTA